MSPTTAMEVQPPTPFWNQYDLEVILRTQDKSNINLNILQPLQTRFCLIVVMFKNNCSWLVQIINILLTKVQSSTINLTSSAMFSDYIDFVSLDDSLRIPRSGSLPFHCSPNKPGQSNT